MNNLDYNFFENYKRLDKLCSDMYVADRGVSTYIEEMEKHFSEGERQVSNWKQDYKMLKHLRWVRNKIAHEDDCNGFAKESDLKDLNDFYQRFLHTQDPLTLLRRASQRSIKRKNSDNGDTSPASGAAGVVLAVLCIALIVLSLLEFIK